MNPNIEILLLPTPRRLTRMDGWATVPADAIAACGVDFEELTRTVGRLRPVRPASEPRAAWLECRLDEKSPAARKTAQEAYALEIRADDLGGSGESAAQAAVRIVAAHAAGLRNGLRTLAQLLRQFPHKLPALAIEDEPAFATRGVMLDVSRCRVPTMESLYEAVEQFAALKYNHLQLYTEHTFAYAGHEEVWRGWSPLTPDEIRRLDVHCQAHGIELAANQNCFGHLAHWLKHPRYAPLAETVGEWQFMEWKRSGPFSLCPLDPGSLALIEDLLGQLLSCFSTKLVNVGCDETFDVGQGRSRDAVAQRGGAVVYLEFVRKVAAVARRRGVRPLFWADIALSHPEALGEVPEDLLALAWGYEPDSPFAEWCARLRAAGRETWVCPGTSSWRSIGGRTRERGENIARAARAGLENGATGFLITDWGDHGHHQQWPLTLHGIAEAAEAAWNGAFTTQGSGTLAAQASSALVAQASSLWPRAAALHVFNDESLQLGPWLQELGDVDHELRQIAGRPAPDGRPTRLRNASALFGDLHTLLSVPEGQAGEVYVPARSGPAPWRAVLERLQDLEARFPPKLPPQIAEELRHALALMRLAAERAVFRRSADLKTSAGKIERRRLAVRLRELVAQHRQLWLRRCRPGGLEQSCAFYEPVAAEMEAE